MRAPTISLFSVFGHNLSFANTIIFLLWNQTLRPHNIPSFQKFFAHARVANSFHLIFLLVGLAIAFNLDTFFFMSWVHRLGVDRELDV